MEKELVKALLERSEGLCERIIAGRRCMSAGDWRGMSRHHKVKRSHGGKDTLENLLVVCYPCHSALEGLREIAPKVVSGSFGARYKLGT